MRAHRLWPALVLALFAAPLFVGLGRGDLRGDEGIYSFGVDRILESGDWLAPKSSPHENSEFLEKPPLKFWIVAAPIRLGLLPHNEFGLRFWDALFGGLGFLYVFAIGRRLAGGLCGAVAVLILFAHGPLLFEHGLRSNNMEGPLFLSYCGSVYHFLKWSDRSDGTHRWHAVATALYFVLGFMTKFVAAVFLPLLLGAAVLVAPRYRAKMLREWRVWGAADLLALALIVPWFAYAYQRFGSRLWDVMLKGHVYDRMTGFLDPEHVQPWYYYLSATHRAFAGSGAEVLVAAGVIVLIVQTVRRRSADGLVLLLWFALPIIAISFGTSKLYHYAYPFLPPLALAGGYVTALVAMLAPAPMARLLERFDRRAAARPAVAALARQPIRTVLLTIAGLAIGIGVGGLLFGQLQVEVGGVILKSSGIFRPAILASLLLLMAGVGRTAGKAVVYLLLACTLPLPAYRQNLVGLVAETRPMSASSDCVRRVEAQVAGAAAPGLYLDLPESAIGHPMYYYFRRVRPWTRAAVPSPNQLGDYLSNPALQRPALVWRKTYDASGRPPVSSVSLPDDVLLLLPGPYSVCSS